MNDIFYEQLVSRKTGKKDNMELIVVTIVYVLTILVVFLIVPVFGMFALIGGGIAYVFYMRSKRKEFEYNITNDEFEIDVITNKSRRKKLLVVNIKDIVFMGKVSDEKSMHQLQNFDKVLDCTSNTNAENTYAFITNIKGNKTKVLIEPDENILNGFSKYMNNRTLIRG